jgi:hypothetical protein
MDSAKAEAMLAARLRALEIARTGYAGVAGTDHDQQAHAVALFLTDAVVQLDLS